MNSNIAAADTKAQQSESGKWNNQSSSDPKNN